MYDQFFPVSNFAAEVLLCDFLQFFRTHLTTHFQPFIKIFTSKSNIHSTHNKYGKFWKCHSSLCTIIAQKWLKYFELVYDKPVRRSESKTRVDITARGSTRPFKPARVRFYVLLYKVVKIIRIYTENFFPANGSPGNWIRWSHARVVSL